jgi:hypothetical protein
LRARHEERRRLNVSLQARAIDKRSISENLDADEKCQGQPPEEVGVLNASGGTSAGFAGEPRDLPFFLFCAGKP